MTVPGEMALSQVVKGLAMRKAGCWAQPGVECCCPPVVSVMLWDTIPGRGCIEPAGWRG